VTVPRETAPPLVVDLDGTLVTTDTFFESALALIRRNPLSIFQMSVWLFSGRARLKSEVAMRIQPNPATLPYRPDLVLWLEARKQSGGRLTLATASHLSTAEAVACYLGFFDEFLGSDALVNLKGTRKRDALIARFGAGGFDYVGDSAADDSVWAACRIAHVAGNRPLPAAVRRTIAAEGQTFPDAGSGGFLAGFRCWFHAARVRQWVKNLLLFLPALLNRSLGYAWSPLLAAFLAFSFVASGTYVLNDLFDLEADRLHPTKRRRPFASGALSIPAGLATALILVVTGFAFCIPVGIQLTLSLLVYAVVSVAYSGFLKNKPVLDVVVLAFLYTWRVYVGGLVSEAWISPWLIQFSIFAFLSLAFLKRFSELRRMRRTGQYATPGRGYRLGDAAVISQAGVGAGLVAGLILALYVNGPEVTRGWPRPYALWGICPIFVYWIVRAWLVAHRGNMNEDPIVFAFRDKVSYLAAALILICALLGMTPNAR
jgi:4-hydroxybenzoate polyprenyltransferase